MEVPVYDQSGRVEGSFVEVGGSGRKKKFNFFFFRVLHMAMSPDGQTIATAAGDETLRFWRAFDKQPSLSKNSISGCSPFASPLSRPILR